MFSTRDMGQRFEARVTDAVMERPQIRGVGKGRAVMRLNTQEGARPCEIEREADGFGGGPF